MVIPSSAVWFSSPSFHPCKLARRFLRSFFDAHMGPLLSFALVSCSRQGFSQLSCFENLLSIRCDEIVYLWRRGFPRAGFWDGAISFPILCCFFERLPCNHMISVLKFAASEVRILKPSSKSFSANCLHDRKSQMFFRSVGEFTILPRLCFPLSRMKSPFDTRKPIY